jgi:hypothetical protein
VDPAPTLFEEAEEESVADLALDDAAVAADQSTRWRYDDHREAAPQRAFAPTFGSAPTIDDVPPPAIERPRPAILPMTFMLILGLLIGFAINEIRHSVGGLESTPPPSQPVAEAPKPAPSPPAAGAASAQSSRAYSEQTVASQPAGTAPRSGEAPPVPGDGPGSEASASPKTVAPSPASRTGRLMVISTPTRAVVTVNGRWRGRTPLTLDTLQFGSYSVQVVQPGFTASNEDVILTARQPMRTLSVHLQPVTARSAPTSSGARAPARPTTTASAPRESGSSSFAGTIYVDSRPRGARVLIDGRPMGTTPASIPDIPIGSHVVRLELEDHRTWTTSTRVTAGEQVRVTGSLERIR